MMNALIWLIVGMVIGAAVGAAVALWRKQVADQRTLDSATARAERLLREAQEQARALEQEARAEAQRLRQETEAALARRRREVEEELSRRRREVQQDEQRLRQRWEDLERRLDRLNQRELALNKRQSALDKRANELERLMEAQKAKLYEIANLSPEEARQQVLAQAEEEARRDIARIIRQIEIEAKEEGERRARKILAIAMQRVASDQVAELTTAVVPLPAEEMKGRIIGRNGRNIRAFEQAAGVDLIVDDTPEAVTISSFDPVRREIARRALTKLVMDGRIHPAQIEKVVSKEREEVERMVLEAGEEAAFEAGVTGLPQEVLKMLGRLKFRTSFGQNQLHHAVETAKLAAMLAAELGADVQIAKTAALLHDIGKAMDHNIEGPHALIGADFLKNYGLPERVVHAVAAHHHDVEQETVEDIIVEVADAISGARPGARRESVEEYIKRVKVLEEIAKSFEGVKECYALQAGREVRVIVRPTEVDDAAAQRLARQIAKKIEEQLQYPGQIKVTVIRETRAVDYAR